MSYYITLPVKQYFCDLNRSTIVDQGRARNAIAARGPPVIEFRDLQRDIQPHDRCTHSNVVLQVHQISNPQICALDGINFSSDTYFVGYWKMCLLSRA